MSLKPLLLSICFFMAAPYPAFGNNEPQPPPNIVLILLDDVGFGDTSTFGGPIYTPTLDRLAKQGLRYNNFHTAGMCGPTRAALLSGRNPHRIGFGTSPGLQSDATGYNTLWGKNAASVAELLRHRGYSTAAFGKWHNTPVQETSSTGPFNQWPTERGFDFFYGFHGGETDQWSPPAIYRNTSRTDFASGPNYHLTTAITDEAIRWVNNQRKNNPQKPYFVFFATGAAHAPHHVSVEWINLYRGKFNAGWDLMREHTFHRQKELGIIPQNADLTPRPTAIPSWSSTSEKQKIVFSRQMEIYAGFLTHADHEIGRLLDAVQESPQKSNTLILYLVGDNGSSGEGGLYGYENPRDFILGKQTAAIIETQLAHLDELGSRKHYNHYAAGWAWSGSTPFQWMKQIASHLGSIRTPLVIAWPNRVKDHGGIRQQFSYVTDITATIYEAARVRPLTKLNGIDQMTQDGISLIYTFDKPNIESRRSIQYFEISGNRAIYHKGWLASARHTIPWIIKENDDFKQDHWELYDISKDFSQAKNLAETQPKKLEELKALFHREAIKNNIYPLNNTLPKVLERQRLIMQDQPSNLTP